MTRSGYLFYIKGLHLGLEPTAQNYVERPSRFSSCVDQLLFYLVQQTRSSSSTKMLEVWYRTWKIGMYNWWVRISHINFDSLVSSWRDQITRLLESRGYRGVQGDTRGNRGLQGVTRGYRRLKEVKSGFRGLKRVTRGWRVTGGYKGLQGVASSYMGLQGLCGVTKGYNGFQGVTGGYKRLQAVKRG